MNLLYICSDFGIPLGGTKGASIHVRSITRALCESGHDVSILSPRPSLGLDHPASLLLAQSPRELTEPADRLRRYMKDRELPHELAGEIRSLQYNEWVASRALDALRDNPPDVVVERLSLFGHAGLDLSSEFGCPLVIEVNALMSEEAATHRGLQMQPLAKQIEDRVLGRADAILAVSQSLRGAICERGVAPSKVHLVPNGADVEAFDPGVGGTAIRGQYGLEDRFVIGFAGSLKSWHGVDLLIFAFRNVLAEDSEARLLIVGTGPTEQALKDQVQLLKLSHAVVFTGAVDHSKMPACLCAMDVAVAPFRSAECFYFSPIKLFEYMASGCCVVASNLGQIEDVIGDGEHGLLCAPDNVESLTQKLLLARNDPSLRKRLASAARARVERDFTWRLAAMTTGNVLSGLVSRSDAVSSNRVPA